MSTELRVRFNKREINVDVEERMKKREKNGKKIMKKTKTQLNTRIKLTEWAHRN